MKEETLPEKLRYHSKSIYLLQNTYVSNDQHVTIQITNTITFRMNEFELSTIVYYSQQDKRR